MSKNIIITGTSSGIGFELVKIFSKKNHRVLALSRNNSKLRDLNLEGVHAVD
jgi:3-oxoacyl-[acyl-carrier protein] reductase